MFPKDRAYRPYFRQNSGMTDLFFCMEPTTDTELLYHTLDLDACYYLEGQVPYWCLINMVNEPLQPRQTRKGDDLTKKRRHQRSADPQQDEELVEALFKLALCIIIMVVS